MSSLDRLLGLEERRGGAEDVDICPSDEEQEEGCPAPAFMEDDLGRAQNSIYSIVKVQVLKNSWIWIFTFIFV